jgi:hypothetical protein
MQILCVKFGRREYLKKKLIEEEEETKSFIDTDTFRLFIKLKRLSKNKSRTLQ